MNNIELDFSQAIKSRTLDSLTYPNTPKIFLETANSNFQYMDIDLKPFLNIPPPLNSSDKTKKEILQIKKFMSKNHSPEFTSNLKSMNKDPAKFVIDFYKNLSSKNISSKIIDFISGGDVEVLAMKLKMHYNRPRPYQIAEHYGIDFDYNKSIQNGAANHPSYPSGHTLSAYFSAKVLSFVDNRFDHELLKRAKMVADSRVIEGVHFQSDNDFSIFLVENALMPAFIKVYGKG
tara:strand:+ start:1853 stop:2551 length:699 start_codon:yes stop_codon:yes gene_type:complete